MSLFEMACPACGEVYTAGMVGQTAYVHHCPIRAERDRLRAALHQLAQGFIPSEDEDTYVDESVVRYAESVLRDSDANNQEDH